MVVCRFFEQGRCNRGDTCYFEHPKLAAAVFRPGAQSLQPGWRQTQDQRTASTDPTQHDPTLCRFFMQGKCKNGFSCRFRHDGQQPQPAGERQDSAGIVENAKIQTPCVFWCRGVCQKGAACRFSHGATSSATPTDGGHHVPSQSNISPPFTSIQDGRPRSNVSRTRLSAVSGDELIRYLGGATVVFQTGAAVKSVSLSSDYSAIQLSGLAPDITSTLISAFIADLGFENIDGGDVRLKGFPNSVNQIAEIKVKNPEFAQQFVQRAGTNPQIQGKTVTASHLQLLDSDQSSGPSAKRLQLNSVLCSWYNPSKIAWLHFGNEDIATKAVGILNGSKKLRGRKLEAKYQSPPIHALRSFQPVIYSVQVGNLDVETTDEDLRRFLRGREPRGIKMGPWSYECTKKDAALQVKRSLEVFGHLADWEVSGEDQGARSKATARFTNPEDARRAAAGLNGKTMTALGDTKIFVNTVTSIKFSVLSPILDAVRMQLDEIRSRSWESTHVHVKVYGAPSHGVHRTLRIFGQDRRAVTQAKTSVEKLLAGTVAQLNDSPIRDAFFFGPDGTTFLQTVMGTHGVFIYRDMRRRLLRIYASPDATAQTTQALLEKAEELAHLVHTIVLTPEMLRTALQGGFRRLVEAFGKDAVKLNIASSPRIITFQGSDKDFARARAILVDPEGDYGRHRTGAPSTAVTGDICPVCWMEPEDPVSGACGHVYCGDCMAGQCFSAGDGSGIPLRCVGASATCNHMFSLKEIQDAVPESVFENLLETSFTSHVRGQPEVFQYCPTPDCDRVYRASTDGRIFLCDNCITHVCTTCHVVAHDGLTCAEAKKLGSENDIAFAKWIKEEENVNECPKCETAIEKTWGCNHMQCPGCRIHICCFCLDIFDTGDETYCHMRSQHGGISD